MVYFWSTLIKDTTITKILNLTLVAHVLVALYQAKAQLFQ